MEERFAKRPPRFQEDEQGPPDKPAAGRPPAKWRDVAEEAIEEAMRSGAFDDLPGRGKPLNLINNPYAPGTELAYQLLRDNEYTLPWISERAAVLAQIQALREKLAASWPAYLADYRGSENNSQRLELTQEWSAALAAWEETIDSLNKDITTVNLKQPGDQLEILKLTLSSELNRAGARRVLG